MGWIGKVSYIPGHLALEVFDELRNLSVPGFGAENRLKLSRAFDFSQSSERVLPSDRCMTSRRSQEKRVAGGGGEGAGM